MLWLLATLATFAALAWRGTRLSHATGVLGILLLLYGWLGDSGGRFLLLLLLFLATAIPLNSPSLRQEWLSRVLLDHLLRIAPKPPTADPAPAAALLSTGRCALPARAPPPPASACAQAALQTLLCARLRQPLATTLTHPAAGQIAAGLLTEAALASVDARFDTATGPARAWLTDADGWQLAQAAQALDAAVQLPLPSPALESASALQTLLANAHAPWRAVLEAAGDPQAYSRLISFDSALFGWLRQVAQHSVRAPLLGVGVGRLLERELGDDPQAPWLRLWAQAQARQALLLDALLLRNFAADPAQRTLLASVSTEVWQSLRALLALQALAQWPSQARSPHLEAPLWQVAMAQQLAALEQAQWRLIGLLPQRRVRWPLKALCFPLGRQLSAVKPEALLLAAKVLLAHPEVSARCLAHHPQELIAEALSRIAKLQALEGPISRMASSHWPEEARTDAEKLQHALRMGLVDDATYAILHDALAHAESLRR